ncbi:predicted protein [Sclerotinia sclerotiorum 1980 UF-70]|uniref:Uncharacterized protein n=1 Tax=Sclerotinia sclerotiorum (strain ATCC 18683 / 1980 / Ss-1) TaxID=665079 RepID=A7EPV4_SCLS1|nr:predicted protein [Sclerotinia sclerotiorum 1980 UF-70]EDO04870.1 predicted protein [Sclerotinia sclerotiorum 1980 UF-70]
MGNFDDHLPILISNYQTTLSQGPKRTSTGLKTSSVNSQPPRQNSRSGSFTILREI